MVTITRCPPWQTPNGTLDPKDWVQTYCTNNNRLAAAYEQTDIAEFNGTGSFEGTSMYSRANYKLASGQWGALGGSLCSLFLQVCLLILSLTTYRMPHIKSTTLHLEPVHTSSTRFCTRQLRLTHTPYIQVPEVWLHINIYVVASTDTYVHLTL